MRRWTRKPGIVALAIAACLLCHAVTHAGKPGAAYTIVPFAPHGVQFDSSGIFGLNDAGDVVGVVGTENGQISYHLDLDTGAYTPLPGRVWSINGCGEIAGTITGDPATDGYYLSALGTEPVLLPPLEDDSSVDVYSINDSRLIVGDSFGPTGVTAVIWRPILSADGTWSVDGPVPLLPLAGDTSSYAIDINDPVSGGPFEILGSSEAQAAIWTIDLNPNGTLSVPSAPMTLGTLDGSPFSGYANNCFGDVCGSAGHAPAVQPFDDSPQALNVVRDTSWGRAMDINDRGHCVGQIEVISRGGNWLTLDAYLWQGIDADPVNLEKLLAKDSRWEDLNYADHISDDGRIAGNGYYDGVATGFIMIPTP